MLCRVSKGADSLPHSLLLCCPYPFFREFRLSSCLPGSPPPSPTSTYHTPPNNLSVSQGNEVIIDPDYKVAAGFLAAGALLALKVRSISVLPQLTPSRRRPRPESPLGPSECCLRCRCCSCDVSMLVLCDVMSDRASQVCAGRRGVRTQDQRAGERCLRVEVQDERGG
eukprot:287645-Hanusia_phi.AAC.2